MEFTVRRMQESDCATITKLTAQLGYPLSPRQILRNIKSVGESEVNDAFVADHEQKVVGWIGVAQIIMIESAPYCEINGLVIAENYQGKGVGKLLIEKAKQWGKEKGNSLLRVRCNVMRKVTHEFYRHLGFTETKEQKNFEVKL